MDFLIESQPFSAMFMSQKVISEPIPIKVTQDETIKINSKLSPDYVKVGDLTSASIIGKQ